MSFYLKPPKGSISFHQFGECAKQRLTCYKNISENNLDLLNFVCLVEDSPLDRTGHYLFRLVAFANSSFRSIFFEHERKLLELRIGFYKESKDVKYFIKKVRQHAIDHLKTGELDHHMVEYFTVLTKVCMQMLRKEYIEHILMEHSLHDFCDQFKIRVPFYHCADLLVNREVNINKGFIEIECKQWKILLLSLYNTYLIAALNSMKDCMNVQSTLQDDRIKEVMQLVQRYYFTIEPLDAISLNLNNINQEYKLFPICMQNLYTILQKTNRLSHNARFDFSLFMKGIGISMTESLQFWESFYSKEHASCSKCTHSWQENEKRYIYGIRHLYGLEGARKNYSVRSCDYLQGVSLGATEEGGCPLKHCDDDSLRCLLKRLLPNHEDEVEVIIFERKQEPGVGCRLFYEYVFKMLSKKGEFSKEISFSNPVQYFKLLKKELSAVENQN